MSPLPPWRPVVLDPDSPADRAALAELRAAGRIWREVDLVDEQLDDLADARAAGRRIPAGERAALVADLLGGVPRERYGRFAWYPWSGDLVRLLPPEAFDALRLDRNHHKITEAEQRRLRGATVGVVGLSVGNAAALTLAQEGACGRLVLADFDTLSTANLNRIRAAVADVGLPKVVVAARQIAAIDPYLPVDVLPEGLTDANVEAFVAGVDVVVEECDSMGVKALVRQAARRRGVPVVMETSDRGLVDVERYDLERDRPLLHGLLPEWPAERWRALDPEARVGIVARCVGRGQVSLRAAASLLELQGTVSSWPQLASDVALGGAVVTTLVRRIVTGQAAPSGRRYVDLERALTGPAVAIPASELAAPELASDTAARDADRPAARDADLAGNAGPVPLAGASVPWEALLAAAVRAPSGGNCQPWIFHLDGDTAWLVHDRARSASLLDRRGEAAMVALGAAAENLVLAASHHGLDATVTPFPVPGRDDVVARIDLARGAPAPDPLASAIPTRVTDRRHAPRAPVDPAVLARLAAAAGPDARLSLLAEPAALDEVGAVLAAVDRVRFLHPRLHAEMMAELRWSREEAERTRDGISLAEIGATDLDEAILLELSRPDVAAFLRAQALGSRLGETALRWLRSASAVGMLSARDPSPEGCFRAGRTIQRVWLSATAAGVGLQPVGVVSYMVRHLGTEAEADYLPRERAVLEAADSVLGSLFREHPTDRRLLLFRLVQAGPPVVRSLRRRLADVVRVGRPEPGTA